MLLKFRYVNWRGRRHEYVVEPIGIELFERQGAGTHWTLHANVVTRDGDPRPEMGPTRRRSFMMTGIRDLEEVRRSA